MKRRRYASSTVFSCNAECPRFVFASLRAPALGHPGAPQIVSVLASLAGFAGGVYLATKIIKRSSQSAAHEGEQATGVVWTQQTTFALGISLLPHLCFLVIWFATLGLLSGHRHCSPAVQGETNRLKGTAEVTLGTDERSVHAANGCAAELWEGPRLIVRFSGEG